MKATVKRIYKYYALLSIGDVDAFLLPTEYLWRKDCKLKNVLKIDSEIQAVVIDVTDQGVMLSVKRMKKDVWKNVDELYHVGQKLKGVIINVVNFGAFVELPDGIQGLLHKNEMSFDGKKAPSEVVEIGQEIDVEILKIEKEERRMAFTIKPFLIK